MGLCQVQPGLMLQSQEKVALPHSNALLKTNHNIGSCSCRTTRTLAKSLLQFMQAEATRCSDDCKCNAGLRDQLQAAQLQLGNLSQTQNIINAVRPFPQPAYITCSPYTSANGSVATMFCVCI